MAHINKHKLIPPVDKLMQMCVSYGINLCFCQIRIYLFGLLNFAEIPDNNICLSVKRVCFHRIYLSDAYLFLELLKMKIAFLAPRRQIITHFVQFVGWNYLKSCKITIRWDLTENSPARYKNFKTEKQRSWNTGEIFMSGISNYIIIWHLTWKILPWKMPKRAKV